MTRNRRGGQGARSGRSGSRDARGARSAAESLYGIHPIREALRARRRRLDTLWIREGASRPDLDALIEFGPEHVSTYELVLEERTPFGRAAAEGRMRAFPDDLCADMMERIEERLGAAEYRRYELTNYARAGFESVHNQRYWAREPVLGIGVGAHSMDPAGSHRPHGARLANPRVREIWQASLEAGRPPASEETVLARGEALSEAFFLSLRRARGLRAEEIRSEFGAPPRALFPDAIETLCSDGLLEETASGDLCLTARGRMLADGVFSHFVQAVAD